jgi:hypothetical protein
VIGVRHGQTQQPASRRDGARPVLLATMSVRIDPAAERMATETALETGAHLVIANLVRLPLYGTSLVLHGPDGAVLPHEDDRDEVRATAQRLADRGVDVELLRVFSTRPVRALSELVHERDVGLVVIGPDARRVRRGLVRRLVRAVQGADCLVWIAPDGFCF